MSNPFLDAVTGYPPSFKFAADGDGVRGEVVSITPYEVTEYGTGEPKRTKAGQQRIGQIVVLRKKNGEEVALWLGKYNQLAAVGRALQSRELANLNIGDELYIARTGINAKGAHEFNAEVIPAPPLSEDEIESLLGTMEEVK